MAKFCLLYFDATMKYEQILMYVLGEFYDLFRAMGEIDLIKETKGGGGRAGVMTWRYK